jgi:hypothetical protein
MDICLLSSKPLAEMTQRPTGPNHPLMEMESHPETPPSPRLARGVIPAHCRHPALSLPPNEKKKDVASLLG